MHDQPPRKDLTGTSVAFLHRTTTLRGDCRDRKVKVKTTGIVLLIVSPAAVLITLH